MRTVANTLRVLRSELAFAEDGGYSRPLGWRYRLVFEDSSICPKGRMPSCPRERCALVDFVPKERSDEPAPCRYIPFDDLGETLDSLYRTGTNDEIQEALKSWLRTTIVHLEAQLEEAGGGEAAA